MPNPSINSLQRLMTIYNYRHDFNAAFSVHQRILSLSSSSSSVSPPTNTPLLIQYHASQNNFWVVVDLIDSLPHGSNEESLGLSQAIAGYIFGNQLNNAWIVFDFAIQHKIHLDASCLELAIQYQHEMKGK
jgi:hypothetical protein